jgi:hypothetical protein
MAVIQGATDARWRPTTLNISRNFGGVVLALI